MAIAGIGILDKNHKRRVQQCGSLEFATLMKGRMQKLRKCNVTFLISAKIYEVLNGGKMKNIKVPEKLFIALVKYHLLDMPEVLPEIEKGLNDKMDAIKKRDLYTKYKSALSEEEREQARKEYQELVGISESFRW